MTRKSSDNLPRGEMPHIQNVWFCLDYVQLLYAPQRGKQSYFPLAAVRFSSRT